MDKVSVSEADFYFALSIIEWAKNTPTDSTSAIHLNAILRDRDRAPAAPPQEVQAATVGAMHAASHLLARIHADWVYVSPVQRVQSPDLTTWIREVCKYVLDSAERPAPDDPRYVAGTCPTCGAQPAPAIRNVCVVCGEELGEMDNPAHDKCRREFDKAVENGKREVALQEEDLERLVQWCEAKAGNFTDRYWQGYHNALMDMKHGNTSGDLESMKKTIAEFASRQCARRAYVEQNADAALATPPPAQEDLERARVEKSHSLQLIESAAARLRESLANTEDYPIGRVYPIVATDAEIILSQLPYLINEHRILGDLLKKAYEQCAFEYNESQRFRRAAQAERQVAGALACPSCGASNTVVSTSHGAYCKSASCKWGWETEMDGSPLKPPLPAERVSAEEVAKLVNKYINAAHDLMERSPWTAMVYAQVAHELSALRPTHTPESGK